MKDFEEKLWNQFELINKHLSPMYPPMLGGGAVRDLVLGKPEQIKDLDIYVAINDSNTSMMDKMKRSRTLQKEFGMHNDIDQYINIEGKNPVVGVWTTKEKDVQIILLDQTHPMIYVTKYFDIGICEAVLDATGEIQVSANFMEDRENRVVRLRPKKDHSYHTIGKAIAEHLPRVAAKYPEYNRVIDTQIIEPAGVSWYNV